MLRIERLLSELTAPAPESPILSVYLWTDPTRGPGRNLRLQLDGALRPIVDGISAAVELRTLEAAVAPVEEYVLRLERPGRGLSLFSSPARGMFHAVSLRVPFVPRAEWSDLAYVRPLTEALDEYERTLIVLADKQQARFLLHFMQEGEELESLRDEVPGHHAQGGYSQAKYQRDHQKHVQWHARRVLETLSRLAAASRVDRILVAGPAEMVAELRQIAPQRLRKRMSFELRAAVGAPVAEVVAAAEEVEAMLERRSEIELVEDIVALLGRGRAVSGAARAVEAVSRNAVAILAYGAGLRVDGGRCSTCGTLYAPPVPDVCRVCGGELRSHDLVDLLAGRVLAAGGRVEELRDVAAARLAPQGGIAALLRYRSESAQHGPLGVDT